MAYDVSKLVTLGQLKSLAIKAHADDKAIIGANTDDTSAITVYGARALADSKVASVSAGNNGVDIGGTATAPTVGLKLSTKTGNALTIETTTGEEGLYYQTPAEKPISVVKKATPNTGYISSYQVTVDGTAVGVDIDIPKDYLVKSAEIKVCQAGDTEVIAAGIAVGEKYIDFTVNTVEGSGNESHIYLGVAALAHVYTAGDGIAISAADVVSVVIDSTNANGLSVGANGVALATVVASTSGAGGSNGAMTAAQAEKLNGLNIATDAEVTEAINEAFEVV